MHPKGKENYCDNEEGKLHIQIKGLHGSHEGTKNDDNY